MAWKHIEVKLTCPSCSTGYIITFQMRGFVPCCAFRCPECNVRYKVTPPEAEAGVCSYCGRRVDCLVDPPFIVNEFKVDDQPIQKWTMELAKEAFEEPVIVNVRIEYADLSVRHMIVPW